MKLRYFIVIITMLANSSFATSLVRVCKDALNQDQTYLAAQAQWLLAQADIPLAQAKLLPNVNLNWFNSISRIHPNGTPNSSGKDNNFTFSLDQPIFNAADWEALKQTKLQVQAARANLLAATQNVLIRATQQYFNVLIAKETLTTLQKQQQATKKEYLIASNKLKTGLITKREFYQAKAEYSSIKADVIIAKNNLYIQQENLFNITNRHYKSLKAIKKPLKLVTPNKHNQAKWVALANKNNYELKSAQINHLAAIQGLSVATLSRAPIINLTSTISRVHSDSYGPPGFFSLNYKSYQLGINVDFPVYQGGAVAANEQQSKANILAAKTQVNLTAREVTTATKTYFQNILANIKTIKARKTALYAARIALKEERQAYKQGTRSINDLFTSIADLQAANEAFITSRYDYLINMLILKETVGILSSDDIISIDSLLDQTVTI